MNNLTKEKKQQILLVAVFTVAILICVWFFGINDQQKRREVIRQNIEKTKKQVAEGEKLLKQKDEIKDRLDQYEQDLRDREATLPNFTGAYQWMIGVVNEYIKPPSSLSNFNTSSPSSLSDVLIIPKFQYRAASYTVTMSGFFMDFGKFLADFENDRPFLRVQNLNIVPASGVPGDERLNFQFEIVSLTLTNKVDTVIK